MIHSLRNVAVRFLQSRAAPVVGFLSLSLFLYGLSLFGEFVYDDAFFTVNGAMRKANYLLRIWFHPSLPQMLDFPHYRPLSFFTFSLNYVLFGESPLSFHAVNILVNGFTCWFLFLLIERLFANRALALFTAVFFAILPIHSEAVAYIKSRDELFVAFFGLLAWLAFLQASTSTGRRRIVQSVFAGIFSLAAFLSKESAIVWPGVLVGSILFLHGWRSCFRAWFPIAMQLAAMAAFFALHAVSVGWETIPNKEILYFGQNPLGYMPPEFIPWTAFELFFIAVSKTFVPWNLSPVYGFQHVPIIDSPLGSWMAPAGVFTLFVLLLLIALPSTRRLPVGIGAMAFLVLYFPFSKIPIVQGIDFFAEHWLYAPSIGLSMIAGYVAWLVWKRNVTVATVLFTAVAVAYISILFPRNFVWMNETSLGESMVRDAPNAVISYTLLANNRVGYARLDEAIELVTKGLTITRDHIPLHQVAAVVAMAEGRLDVAEQAISAAENLADEMANDLLRATLIAKQHRFEESLRYLRSSRWFLETDFRVRLLLALNLWRLGRFEEAEQYFDWDALSSLKMTRDEKIQMLEAY